MDLNFPKLEKKILKFWKDNRIFQKSIERRKKAPNFVFYEGPPTANAKPGIHHILARIYKDIVCRYKAMRGFRVLRKSGWDTHGLPVEIQIEKALGLKNKKDIEKYGIAKFNKKCRESVWQYKKDWEKLTERIAFWLDMENPYITYTPDYIKTVWWIIKQIFKRGWVYQDYKVIPYCPRCGTSLSSHEVALGYKKIKEPAIYVKFQIAFRQLADQFQTEGRTYLLVWTTTPWTLPGNVAIAVNPKFIYVKAKVNNDYLVLAKERLSILGKDFEIVKEFEGKELVGLRYEGFYPSDGEIRKQGFRVIPANFVSLEEGTGLVHIAPAFGEEDMEAGKENNLPTLLNVDGEGKFTLDVKKWAGLFVKDADPLIIEDLKQRNILFKDEIYEHDYPFCWRCNSPLLYYAKQSWFIEMQKVKKELIENNQKINWIPAHLKSGRFGEWLKEIKDWAFSRERYWGTPLPIWQCKTCRNLEVIGSLEDLLSQRFSNNNYFILRHGDSLRQRKKVAMCWPEKIYCPLTKKGEEEVKIAAKKLKKEKIGIIFSSDLLRTKQTAEILSQETGTKIVFNKNLREFNVGIFNGKDPKLAWDYLSDVVSAKLPKGESLMGVRKRMYGFLKEIDKKYQDKNILIVSHELPLTILEGALNGSSIGEILEGRKEKKIKTIKTGEFRRVEFKNLPFDAKMELDFHRPYVDEVKFFCSKCKGIMERAPEVIDCWFDSGAMPFAQYYYPFENKELIDKKIQFPADYISEAVDQTRGWFYTQLAISTLLGFGTPYKNVISLGHVLDEKGEKMSKSKGNVVDPWYIIGKYGVESTRWYFYTVNQPGDAKLFSEKDVDQALKKFILTLWNCFLFYNTYAKQRGKKHKDISGNQRLYQRKSAVLLDEWIISKLNTLIKDTTQKLDKYDVTGAARAIENFVVEDLSLWYIRRSRRRLQKPKTKKELKEASEVLNCILLTVCKLSAPFIPFLSEEIYQRLKPDVKRRSTSGFDRSVHLEDWPEVNKKLINNQLEKKMLKVREVVTLALAERAKAGIKVRQPLQKLKIKNGKLKIDKQLLELIKDEVNVKEIVFDRKIKKEVELDIEITPELKEEGMIREVIRNIQEMRKIAGLKPRDKILAGYSCALELSQILAKNKEFILREAKVKDLIFGEKNKETLDLGKEIKVDQQILWLTIKKV